MKPVKVTFKEIMDSMPINQLEDFSPDYVIGIERGGVVLAAVVAFRLNEPLFTIRASLYDDSKPAKMIHEAPKITGSLPLLKGKRVLIIDDVSKSGKTLAAVKEHSLSKGAAEARTFVYAGKADFSCRAFDQCLVFPWEVTEK